MATGEVSSVWLVTFDTQPKISVILDSASELIWTCVGLPYFAL